MEKKTNLQVSYFAAGIVAHLASDRPELWTVAGTPKNVITTELWKVGEQTPSQKGNLVIHQQFRHNIVTTTIKVVSGWTYPAEEMVAYRSFKPFFPLLQPLQAGIFCLSFNAFFLALFCFFLSPFFYLLQFTHCCILDRKRQCSFGQSGQYIMSAPRIQQGLEHTIHDQ